MYIPIFSTNRVLRQGNINSIHTSTKEDTENAKILQILILKNFSLCGFHNQNHDQSSYYIPLQPTTSKAPFGDESRTLRHFFLSDV